MTTRNIPPAAGSYSHTAIVDDRIPDHLVALDVDVSLDGQFAPDVAQYARRKVLAAAKHCSDPILRASARLIRYSDPALPRPVVARATLNVNGRTVRAQSAAATAREALDALQKSLHNALERIDRHPKHPHRPTGGGARDEREIRPLGAVAGSCEVEEAIGALDALDRDFQLFRDVDTGEDTLVYRGGPTGYRLAQLHHRPLERPPATPVAIDLGDAPRLTPEQAAERLECDGKPFVFFADPDTGRGQVLHVRYDGHFGLLSLS